MDKDYKKTYAKAMSYYQDGQIEKAIELCEKGISLNMKNAPLINLKGMLLYLSGDLNGAKALWALNKDFNNDGVAKKYLEDIKFDYKRQEDYEKALEAVKKLKIAEALSILEFCRESDFNKINVNNLLTCCYIKLGDYEKAKECLQKVFELDKKNKTAEENKKLLKKYGNLKNKASYGKYIVIVLCIAMVIGAAYLIKYYFYHKPNKDISYNKTEILEQNKEEAINKNKDEVKVEKDTSNSENKDVEKKEVVEEKKQVVEEKFPEEEFKKYLSKKDFNNLFSLYSTYKSWKEKPLSINEKSLLVKSEELLMKEGAEFFYNEGKAYISKGENLKASEAFLKAFEFGKGSYLHQHALYMLGYSYEQLKEVEKASAYYEEYLKYFPKANYSDIVLYNLAMMYKSIDINKSKEYALKIVERYPKSQYNNINIQQILNQ